MKTTVNEYQFTNNLLQDGNANWSYNGAKALYEYFEQLEDDGCLGEDFDAMDNVAIRCDFSEYETIGMIADNYNNAPQADEYDDPDEWDDAFMDWLRNHTTVLEFDGGLIIHEF